MLLWFMYGLDWNRKNEKRKYFPDIKLNKMIDDAINTYSIYAWK